MTRIQIVSVPDGNTEERCRLPYVGCVFTPHNTEPIPDTRPLYCDPMQEDETSPPPVFQVPFQEVIDGLRRVDRYDWADHLLSLQKPQFVLFPVTCCERIPA